MKRFWPLAAIVFAGGCSLNAPMQHLVVDQNAVLAKTTDEVMLANILRAMNNEPMHFSLVQTFHGTATLSAGLTLAATFPGNGVVNSATQGGGSTSTTSQITPGVNTLSPAATGSFSETPSFDSAIIDSQSFFQGFLKPISPAVVGHFLYDRWPSRLLTYLLVERFELVAAYDYDQAGNPVDPDRPAPKTPAGTPAPKLLVTQGELVGYLDNSVFTHEQAPGVGPAHAGATNPFVDFVDHFQLTGIATTPETDSALFKVDHVSTLAGIEKVDGNSYDMKGDTLNRLDGGSPRLILSRFKSEHRSYRLNAGDDALPFYKVEAFRDVADYDTQTCSGIYDGLGNLSCAAYIPVGKIFTEDEVAAGEIDNNPRDTVELHKIVKGKPVKLAIRLKLKPVLRSPESAFFLAGEYLRKLNDGGDHKDMFLVSQDAPWAGCATGNLPNGDQPMLRVITERPAHALLSAELDGTRYYIPDSRYDCNGQSMKVLTLLEQLFYLQVSSSDKLGITPTVHVVP